LEEKNKKAPKPPEGGFKYAPPLGGGGGITTQIIFMKSVVKKSCACNTKSEAKVAQCCAKVSNIVAGCHD